MKSGVKIETQGTFFIQFGDNTYNVALKCLTEEEKNYLIDMKGYNCKVMLFFEDLTEENENDKTL